MSDSFEAFKMYIGLKNHFTIKKFNYVKYNGKSKLSLESFEKRKDRIFFQKLSKHNDIQGFLVANFIKNPKIWIKELVYSEESEREYQNWLKKTQSLTYTFKQDLSNLDENFNNNFKIEDNQHPIVLKLYLGDKITLETFCILFDLLKIEKYFNKKLKNDPIWDETSLKMTKYLPFVNYDEKKMKKIVVDLFGD